MEEKKEKVRKSAAKKKKKDGRRRKVPRGMRAIVAQRAHRANIFSMSQAELQDFLEFS